MPSDPIEVTAKVSGVLEELGVPYLICGSLASTIFGMIRTTQDSDMVAMMSPKHVLPFVEMLESEFYIDDQMISKAITNQSSFNIIHRASMFKVDIFIPVASQLTS